MLNYVTANYGPPANYLYAIAQTGYYSSKNWSSVSTILTGEMAASDANRAGYLQSRATASYYGLHSFTYEGGESETAVDPSSANGDPTMPAKFAANRDSGMQQVLTHDVLTNWFPCGGELYMQFSQVSGYSVWGFWGITEDITNLQTPKWLGAEQVLSSQLPAATGVYQMPTTSGASVTIPEAVLPANNGGVAESQPWLQIPLEASSGGTFSMTIQGLQKTAGPLDVWVDNKKVGSFSLASTQQNGKDPISGAVTFTVGAGPHGIFGWPPVAYVWSLSGLTIGTSDVATITKE